MSEANRSLTLSCIGAGRAGKTLCKLFTDHQCQFDISIQQIINRTLASASEAVSFIGQGLPAENFENLKPADIWLILTPDDEIAAVSQRLSLSAVLRQGDIVLHCSGSLSSQILYPSATTIIAPRCTQFTALPTQKILWTDFSGTACAVEGDPYATAILTELFSAIGGQCFALKADKKTLYHAATVMACNNLISLLSLSQQMLEAAGVDSATGDNLFQPLIENTLKNYFRSDGVEALTGPISRGDSKTVEAHIDSLKEHPDWQGVYSSLGEVAVSLATQQGYASKEQLKTISNLLDRAKHHE